MFDTKDPFATNNILIRLWRNKGPGLCLKESLKFGVHSIAPFGVTKSLGNSGGDNDKRESSVRFWVGPGDGAICKDLRPCDVMCGSGGHAMRRRDGLVRGGAVIVRGHRWKMGTDVRCGRGR